MSELTDKEKAQVQAETARKNLASRTPIKDIIERVDKWNGAGLNPSEVLALRNHIQYLQDQLNNQGEEF